ncbi:MAG: IclR family transcriptional regulator [Chloroflexota bacterium]
MVVSEPLPGYAHKMNEEGGAIFRGTVGSPSAAPGQRWLPESAGGVARYLGVDRSTGWRILRALADQGWVNQDAGATAFSLNVTHLYDLAASTHEHPDLPGLVTPTLTRIRDRLGESSVLGVPSNSSMVYLVFVSSRHAVTVREAVGWVRPMHASALGKAYLSALDESQLEETLARLDFQDTETGRAPKSANELRHVTAHARQVGYATDMEECLPGVICVAVPLHVGQERMLVGSIGINGPRDRLVTLGIEQTAQVIREEVAHLEDNFAQSSGAEMRFPQPLRAVGSER